MSKIGVIRESDFPELLGAAVRSKAALLRATEELNDAMKAACPIKVGERITAKDGTVAEVTKIEVKYGQVRIVACLLKKDGTVGKREAPLWRSVWKEFYS